MGLVFRNARFTAGSGSFTTKLYSIGTILPAVNEIFSTPIPCNLLQENREKSVTLEDL